MTPAQAETAPGEALRAFGLLACVVFAAYGNALLWGAFQFDDYNVIVDNPRVHSWQAWRDDLAHGIRPLLKLTYTLDWTAGWGAPGFHLTNISIHLANAFLVWTLARRFAARQALLQPRAATMALLGALLFALHPIHSEAVAYICGRSSALMSLFYLAGLLAHAADADAAPGRAGRGPLLAALGFALALGAKETAVTFPLALLAWDRAYGVPWRSALRRQWPSWAVLAAAAAFFAFNDNYIAHMQRSAELNNLAGNIATQAGAVAWLLRQWALPLWLDIDPDLPLLRDFAAAGPQLLALATMLLLTPLALRRRPWLGFAMAWTLIHLLPLHLLLPRLDVANERQMYLAAWPLAFVLAAELTLGLRHRRRTFGSLAAALLLLGGGLTIGRNRDYRSEIALWEATATESPDKARVRNNLGYAYGLAGRDADARREYRLALRLDPDYVKARGNLARLDQDRPR